MKLPLHLTLLALVLISAGCKERGSAQAQTTTELHGINLRVHPDNATVMIRSNSAGSSEFVSIVEQQGPLAQFRLPAGTYSYQVRSQGFVSFENSLSVPKNKNLEVWLQPTP